LPTPYFPNKEKPAQGDIMPGNIPKSSQQPFPFQFNISDPSTVDQKSNPFTTLHSRVVLYFVSKLYVAKIS